MTQAGLVPLHLAAVNTVCVSGCDYDTIQDAVDAANDGDIIKVAPASGSSAM